VRCRMSPVRSSWRAALGVAVLGLVGCRSHDAGKELAISGIQTYWIVDSPEGADNYISPSVRFRLKNVGPVTLGSVQARARFPAPGQDEVWGSIQEQVSTWQKPLEPGKETTVTIRSVGRYHAAAEPPDILRSPAFQDPRAEIFVRIGSSPWAKLSEMVVERRIGAPDAMKLGPP
jgi:hypothetical protein